MQIPKTPPPYLPKLAELAKQGRLQALFSLGKRQDQSEYLHWDKLRHLKPPEDFTSEEWWAAIKFKRAANLKSLSLQDKRGNQFSFSVPEIVQKELREIDVGAGGSLKVPEPITNPQTRDHYLVRSLMEEAITSSQLEGAVTTREVAKEMIRSGGPLGTPASA